MKYAVFAGLLLFFTPIVHPGFGVAQQDPIEVRVNKKIDEVFESTETKYKREQKEADEKAKMQEELKQQQQEIQDNQRILDRNNHSAHFPSERNSRASGGVSREGSSTMLPSAKTGEASGVRVVVFSASNCPDCEKVKQFLKGVQVPFISYDLGKDKNAETYYVNNIGRGVIPVTEINGTVVRGYDPDEMRRLIREAR